MTKNFKIITGIVVLCLPIFLGMSPGVNNEIKNDFLQRMELANDTIQSLESDFIQERTLSIMEDALISKGKFYYKKPGLMKWDQVSPNPYYFILKGNKVLRFDGKKVKEIPANSPQVSHFKDFIMGTVDGSLFTSDLFESKFTREKNSNVKIVLTPLNKSMKNRISNLALVFDYDKMILLNLVIFEANGDQTKILFSNQKLNTITNNSVFQ